MPDCLVQRLLPSDKTHEQNPPVRWKYSANFSFSKYQLTQRSEPLLQSFVRSPLLSPRNLTGGRRPRTNQPKGSHTQTGKPLLLSLLNQLNPPFLSYPNTTATSTPFSASLTFTFFTILLFVALQKRRHFSSILLHYTPVTSSELPRPLIKPHLVRNLRFG